VSQKNFDRAMARLDVINGMLMLDDVQGDVCAERNGWAAIYSWTGNGKGGTREALKMLRKFSPAGIEVHDPGAEGLPSRKYWDKMFDEGYVDRMVDRYGKVIKAKPNLSLAARQKLTEWFGGSEVVDHAGNPMIVYHASANEWETDAFRRKTSAGGTNSIGYHFGTAAAARERIQPAVDDVAIWDWSRLAPHTMAVYLRVENPLRLRDIGAWHDASWLTSALKEAGIEATSKTVAGITKELKALGYDGIVYTNKFEAIGSESWVAFDPKQIKSAIGNSGLFSRESDSLTDWIGDTEEEAEEVGPRERMRA
jgi:hypothetical protein